MIGVTLPGPLTVLCIGAHPDDIEIGCGATLLELAARGDTSFTHVLLTGSPQRVDEARTATELFVPGADLVTFDLPDGRLPAHWGAAKEALESVAQGLSPDLILAPRLKDAHQDHRVVAELVSTTWRDCLTLHYEIPKWDGDLGQLTHYVTVPEETARRKVELLHKAYPSQQHRDWWDDEMFLGMMRVRGMECRSRYAEAFEVAKELLTL
ncbi:PIG-L family deacetylase [Knoellia locipacati]|uniref:GlcNAc-PI de-N-acetylase n=1 Tax=Knoellia locipacati TaxID=882824 RepID=A0A512T3Q2_9MICO|nr:PIG-L deacetylase family protein [Knoellia locipacati]GEQ14832.1 GlcNAc-PI de-N-acetylase [Knoellia locipacati]